MIKYSILNLKEIKMIFILTLLLSLYMGWSMGANDAANCVGADIGSGVMKLRDGIIITILFSFLGAILLGSNVIKTIGKGVVPLNILPEDVSNLISMASLFGAGTWITIATYKKYPVSTSHSIVGAIWRIGFHKGVRAINFKLAKEIIVTWALTSLISGIISYAVIKILLFFIRG
jgi:phosphate/sulfate permease